MKSVVQDFSSLFVGRGRAIGVEPILIEVDESIKPIQQKRRVIPLNYVERFETLLDNLMAKGVVSGWLQNCNRLDTQPGHH